MFHCCCIPDCSSTFNREHHLSFIAQSLKSKTLLKCWVHVISWPNLPLNRHPWICSKHFANAEGRRLYPNKVQLLALARPFISSGNKMRKTSIYNVSICKPRRWACHNCRNYASLVKQASVHLRSPEVPEIVSPSPPTSPGLLGHRAGGSCAERKGEVGNSRKAMQGPPQKKRRWTNAQLLHERSL